MKKNKLLTKNQVVQLSNKCGIFSGCFMIITKVKSFGCQGYVPALDERQIYYRANWSDMELIGVAAFIIKEDK